MVDIGWKWRDNGDAWGAVDKCGDNSLKLWISQNHSHICGIRIKFVDLHYIYVPR